jgi:glycosyltransferase involved in cell wall biosynthesis
MNNLLNVPIFNFNQNFVGGTEYQCKIFHEKILPTSLNFEKYLCMVLPGINVEDDYVEKYEGEILFWMHCLPSQFDKKVTEKFFNGNEISDKIKYIIVPSNWTKAKFIEETGFPAEKIQVINNGINTLQYNPNKFKDVKKVKIIHNSGNGRGMVVLLNALKYIKHDFELNIFNDFDPEIYLQDELLKDDRVNFYGRTPRKTMYKHIEDSHLHAYPPIFEETFCIAIAESMSAGLLPVTSNIGAIPEITNGHGLMLQDIPKNDEAFDGDTYAEEYAKLLNQGIEMILENKWDPTEQIEYINSSYNWDVVTNQWNEFNKII